MKAQDGQAGGGQEAAGDEADDRTATVDRIPDPAGSGLEAVWEAEWEKRLLTAALESVKQRVSPRQYQMFDLHVLPQSKRGRSDDYRYRSTNPSPF